MDIIRLNEKIEEFVNKNGFEEHALLLKDDCAIQSSEEWQKRLDGFEEEGRLLKVGIIGRVKAGKSSLLNALLFDGNDILPKAATPMTAALTIMEYGEDVRAEVDFFTQKDIDNFKSEHDRYLQLLDEKIVEVETEELERKSRKGSGEEGIRGAGRKFAGRVKDFLNMGLSEEERQQIRQAVEKDLQDHPLFASYDQYKRIESFERQGTSLRDLEKYKSIQADSVEDLIGKNGKLKEFVGAGGKFMPFTKSVTLYIPEKGLQGLQIIDTPGVNDPVMSRVKRTTDLLGECDIVLLVMPSGQFFAAEDINLLTRAVSQEGTGQAYIIASKIDDQLFNEEMGYLSHPDEVLHHISTKLTGLAEDTLSQLASQDKEMKRVADNFKKNNVICSSSMAFSLARRFSAKNTWDDGMKKVWENLQKRYPKTFQGSAESAATALKKLANIDKLHEIFHEFHENKQEIQAKKSNFFKDGKRKALQKYLKGLEDYIKDRVRQIETTSVNELQKQKTQLESQRKTIHEQVGDTYKVLLVNIRVELNEQLEKAFSETMNKYHSDAEKAKGTAKESRQEYAGRGGFLWLFKQYKTVEYDVIQVRPTIIVNSIMKINQRLINKLDTMSEKWKLSWKEQVQEQVTRSLREVLPDDALDANMIKNAARKVVACLPNVSFPLVADIPEHLNQDGELKGTEADNYLGLVNDYLSGLDLRFYEAINSYTSTIVDAWEKVDFAKKLTGNLEKELSDLSDDIKNKKSSLDNYRRIQKELVELQKSAA